MTFTNQDRVESTRKVCSACGQAIESGKQVQPPSQPMQSRSGLQPNGMYLIPSHKDAIGDMTMPAREVNKEEYDNWRAEMTSRVGKGLGQFQFPQEVKSNFPRPIPERPDLPKPFPVGGVRPHPTFPTRPNLPNIPDRSTPDVSKKIAERKYPTRQNRAGSVIQQRNWYKQ